MNSFYKFCKDSNYLFYFFDIWKIFEFLNILNDWDKEPNYAFHF